MVRPKVAGGVEERFGCAEKQKSSALQIAIVGALTHIKTGVPSKFCALGRGLTRPIKPGMLTCVRYRTYRILLTVSESG